MNEVMRQIKVSKVTLNMGVGGPGDKLEKAIKLLNQISNKKPVQTKAGPRARIPTWGVRPNIPLGCKVTLRGKEAEELLKRLLVAVDNKLKGRKFDNFGNFSFGIEEYINIPNVKYDPAIGVIGLEVAVTLERPGFRVKRRKLRNTKIGKNHLITKEEAINFMIKNFDLKLGDEE